MSVAAAVCCRLRCRLCCREPRAGCVQLASPFPADPLGCEGAGSQGTPGAALSLPAADSVLCGLQQQAEA